MVKVILSVLFFGLTAQASCPDLTGTFVDKSQGNAGAKLIVKQSETNGVTTYELDLQVDGTSGVYAIIADGTTRRFEETQPDGVFSIAETYTCAEGQLNEVFSETFTQKNGVVADKIEGTGVFKINSENNFIYTMEYTDLSGNVNKGEEIYHRE